MSNFPAFYMILPLLYFGATVLIAVMMVVAFWRIMRAQEATARALQEIAVAIDRRER